MFFLYIWKKSSNFAAEIIQNMNKHFYIITLRIRHILLCILILSVFSPSFAANKTKRFSKKYNNERLEVVLNDLCKRNGYTLDILDEIDLDKRITVEFNNAATSSVLRKVLDSDIQGKVKKGILTISRKPTPPIVYTVAGTTPSSEIDNDSINEKTYQDTTFTVTCKMVTYADTSRTRVNNIEDKDSLSTKRKAHNFQVLAGGGYGTLGYTLGDAGRVSGEFSGNLQLRYLYYFNDNWGVGFGVGFSNYSSKGRLNDSTRLYYVPEVWETMSQTDSEGERYGHKIRLKDWSERQTAYMIDIPVMVQCTYPIRNVAMKHGPLKLYADLGVNIGFCVGTSVPLLSGSVEHVGYYLPWHLELEQITGHDFYTEQIDAFNSENRKLDIQMPLIGVMADFGFAIPVAANWDILVGAYMNYTLNDAQKGESKLGWMHDTYTGDLAYRNHEFMDVSYTNLANCELATWHKPWQVGIRVGFNFHMAEKAKPAEPTITYRRENVCDTTFTLQARVETVVKPKPVVVEKIKHALEKSIIWFDINSTEPKLEPADILDKVAEILKESPEQKIMVTGHASKEGTKVANQRLSEARAKTIVDILIGLGVNADQIQSQGKGVEKDYVEGKHDISLDRRVEITPIAK